MDSPKKRHSDASNKNQGSPRISPKNDSITPPTSAPERMGKSGSSRKLISIEALDGAAAPPLGLKDTKKHHSSKRHSSSSSSKRHVHDEESHWTDSVASSRRSGLVNDHHHKSSKKILDDGDEDIISLDDGDHKLRRHSHKRTSGSRSPHRRSGTYDDGERGSGHHRRSSSSRRLTDKSPSKSPSRRRSSTRRHSKSPTTSPTRRRSSTRRHSKSPSKSPTRSNHRGGGGSSRRDLLERSKSPSRSHRGSSRRDMLQGSKSPSKSHRSRRSLLERSKSPSRSNRGGGSRRDLLTRSKSPSRSSRGGESRRDMLLERSKSPSRSNRGSRRSNLSREGSTRKRNSNNRPSLEDSSKGLPPSVLDDIPNLMEAQQRNKNNVGGLNPQKKKFLTGIIICLMLLLGIAAGVAWFLLTQDDSSETPATLDETAATTSPSVPLEPPSSVPTSMPSDNPTNVPQLFDPPNQEDCFNIRGRAPVSNQDDMILTPFGLDFDVTVVPGALTAFWVDSFMDKFFRTLVPDLTGCDRRQRRRKVLELPSVAESHHQQRQLNGIRYAIGNVNATGEVQLGKSCEDGAPQPCYRFVIKMDLYLKDEDLSNFQLISLVVSIVNPPDSEESLIQRMGLPPSLFEDVAVVLLGSTTESPSAEPSPSPSESPSLVPSAMPSSAPSESPTPRPTLSPTLSPSKQPSRVPSSSPSLLPSTLPSLQPSSRPSLQPSSRPSRQPSSRPSMVPSLAPSASPSIAVPKAPN
ncbi:unnamed protein product [Cylindrotheca closterium]|uniref:Uncharacterized protein n=1 Tax=Cylindrotheca closterium TaxID=2856 RepID=A0AAD2JGP4_9STRA|nr:unnamed protein product [Cylindrotheca closterium]